jgi:hypothetical protein
MKEGLHRIGCWPTVLRYLDRRLTAQRLDPDVAAQGRLSTCAVTRRRFPVGARPTRRSLQPEATGAGMEVTKCLKPPDSGHEIR